MNQRLRILRELGDEFERTVRPADRAETLGRGLLSRVRLALARVRFGRAAIALAVSVAIVVAVGAIVLLGHPHRNSQGVTGGASERQLVARYAVLRRPQTAADRAAGLAPLVRLNRPGRSYAHSESPTGKITNRQTRIIVRPVHYTYIPALTRVIARDGTTVTLFVLRADPNPAFHGPVRRSLRNNLHGYFLVASLAGPKPTLALVAPLPARRLATPTALNTRTDKVVAVVPDGVARVRWAWPRQFNPDTLTYEPALSVEATVRDNVAIAATARMRFIAPLTATWYAADGAVIRSITNPNNRQQLGTSQLAKPAPQTPLSRRAERDPATPNPVVVIPTVGTLNTDFNYYFRALLNDAAYGERLTGGPHPGCATSYAGAINRAAPGNPFLRGETAVFLSQSHRSGSESVHIGRAPAVGFGVLNSMVCDPGPAGLS
jgi:hypothetical protein